MRRAFEDGFQAGLLTIRDAFPEADSEYFDDIGSFYARDFYDEDYYPIYTRGQIASQELNRLSNTRDAMAIKGTSKAVQVASKHDSTIRKSQQQARLNTPSTTERMRKASKDIGLSSESGSGGGGSYRN